MALIGRKEHANTLVQQLSKDGEAEAFPVETYDHKNLHEAFSKIKSKWPDSRLKTSVWNTAQWSRIPFLDITEEDIKKSVQINMYENPLYYGVSLEPSYDYQSFGLRFRARVA